MASGGSAAGIAGSIRAIGGVKEISRLVIDSPHPEGWVELARDGLGLDPVTRDGEVEIELARGKRIVVRPAPEMALAEIHWAIDAPAGSFEEARTDPTGIVNVVRAESMPPAADPEGVELGHVMIGVHDFEESKAFYLDELGLKISDLVHLPRRDVPDTFGLFVHARDGRHHSVALLNGPPGLKHVMVEVASIDAVGVAHERCVERRAVAKTFGRHSNDETFSFYAVLPDGVQVEVGHGGITVDETWTERTLDRPSTWGHRDPRLDVDA